MSSFNRHSYNDRHNRNRGIPLPKDKITIFLVGIAVIFFAVTFNLISVTDILLGIRLIQSSLFVTAALTVVICALLIVIGIGLVAWGLSLKSEPMKLAAPPEVRTDASGQLSMTDNFAMMNMWIANAKVFYVWGFRAAGIGLCGFALLLLLFAALTSLPSVQWSHAKLTIWPLIYTVALVIPAALLVTYFLVLKKNRT